MKILICDYKEELNRDILYEEELLRSEIDSETLDIEVYPYEDDEKLIKKIKDVDVLLTAFINIDKKILESANKLKLISVNATGYGNIDIDYAATKGIAVCNVAEYCTQEVAEHVLALILSLSRNLKEYSKEVEYEGRWTYLTKNKMLRLEGQTMAIFGLGRIGQAIAKRVMAFGVKVIAVDPYIDKVIAEKLGVTLVDKEYALKNSDIISNNMNATEGNKYFFDRDEFLAMKKSPIFINAARGSAVNEEALIEAIDSGVVRAAGLDVLESENPDLKSCKLLNRSNVIITPHAAFYSDNSMRELQRISCENIIHYINGDKDKVFKIVNGI